MKRRSFIGSLLAMITAAFALPRIPKPAADPEGVELIMDVTGFKVVAGENFEIGAPVFINDKGYVEKWRSGSKSPIIGHVHQLAEYTLDTTKVVGGIIE